MIPHRRPAQEEGIDSWLMSYADMITLLLCFFIIFVSVSEPKKERLTAVTDGMAGKFGTVDLATPFQGVYHQLEAVIEKYQVFKDVDVVKTERGLTTELSSGSFFKKGTADLDDSKLSVLDEMAEALKKIDFMDYFIVVESYTSDEPLVSSVYPSNWELSSARADRIVRYFIDHGIAENRLKAVGYGPTQPKVPNLDVEGKPIPENREKNQRIVIKVEQIS